MTELDAFENIQPSWDRLAASLRGWCPGCGKGLSLAKPKYGWGSMGAQYKCSSCGLQVRIPWKSLERSSRKLGRVR